MSRWALFVDAGWLFAAGSVSALGERIPRRELDWETDQLTDALVERASQLVPASAELLRTYWYDGSPNRLPIGDQQTIAALPDVKLRLGRTARDGQKGVDGLIIHDLITHAYRRTIDDAVVISGDEDLLDAIESAQANGTRVHLLEIPIGGIADALLRAVDRRGLLDETFWQLHIRRREVEVPESAPPISERPTTASRLGPSERPAWLDQPLPEAVSSNGSSQRQIDLGEVVDAGASFAETWAANASGDDYAELMAARPYLPREIDSQLLRSAASDGAWLDQVQKRTLRDAFWTSLAESAPGRAG